MALILFCLQILTLLRKALSEGKPRRVKHTLPTMTFQALKVRLWNCMRATSPSHTHACMHYLNSVSPAPLQVAVGYYLDREEDEAWEKKCSKVFSFARQTILKVAEAEFHALALKLFLQAALAINQTRFEKTEALAYEFCSQVRRLVWGKVAGGRVLGVAG